jgi:hypothetical protein
MRPIQIFSTLVALLSVVSAQLPSVIPRSFFAGLHRRVSAYTSHPASETTINVGATFLRINALLIYISYVFCRTYRNKRTGKVVDFYEIRIKSFKKNIFKGLGDANFVRYDGMVPGPTFRVPKGRETVIRFINEQQNAASIHLHGSYSRAGTFPFPTN